MSSLAVNFLKAMGRWSVVSRQSSVVSRQLNTSRGSFQPPDAGDDQAQEKQAHEDQAAPAALEVFGGGFGHLCKQRGHRSPSLVSCLLSLVSYLSSLVSCLSSLISRLSSVVSRSTSLAALRAV